MSSKPLYWLTDNVIRPYQTAFTKIGLDSSWKVGLAAGALTAAGLWYARPDFAFDPQTGQPRPWSLIEPETPDPEQPAATRVPWYVVTATVFYTLNLIA